MTCRLAVVLLVFVLGFGPVATLGAGKSPVRGGTSQVGLQFEAGVLDLAALTLRPEDIEASGWVHVGAFVQPLVAEAADVAGYRGRGLSGSTVADELRAVGWVRKYVAVLGLASSVDPATTTRLVRSYVTEYADAAGAASGFAYLEDESDVPSAEDVPLSRPLGEQAEATRDRGTSGGRPSRSLDVTFRVGNLVAGVTVVNYPSRDFVDPEVDEAQGLAEILATRLASPPLPGSTLGGAVLRLDGSERSLTTYDDAYYRLAEVDVTQLGETRREAEARTATYAEATDVYQLWQGVDAGSEAGALYGVTLLRFPDEVAATAWVKGLADLLQANPFYGDLRPASESAAIGDQSVALAYTPGGGTGAPHALLLAVRVGADVARVHLVPQGQLAEVPIVVLEELARAQVACLQVLSCPDAAAVPVALDTALATAVATPVPAVPTDATPVAATPGATPEA